MGGADLHDLRPILLSGLYLWCIHETNNINLRPICNSTHRNINADLNASLWCKSEDESQKVSKTSRQTQINPAQLQPLQRASEKSGPWYFCCLGWKKRFCSCNYICKWKEETLSKVVQATESCVLPSVHVCRSMHFAWSFVACNAEFWPIITHVFWSQIITQVQINWNSQCQDNPRGPNGVHSVELFKNIYSQSCWHCWTHRW